MPIKIIPYSNVDNPIQDPLILAIEQKISELLPSKIKQQIQEEGSASLYESMPIFQTSQMFNCLHVSFLCQGEYTNGVGRYVDDTLSQWLVPEKNLLIISKTSLLFSFSLLPDKLFFFNSITLKIESPQNAETAEKNLKPMIDEISLNIQAVYRARYVAALKHISLEQKYLMIQDNLNKLLNLSPQESDQSLFDHLHGFFVNLNRDKKIGKIQKTIEQLTQTKGKSFDKEMFSEMSYFTVLFKDQFSPNRQNWYISRIVALHYLFKKVLLDAVQKSPLERHLSLKIYKIKINAKPVLGILLGINILHESEGLEQRFLLRAIRTCIPGCEAIKDSYLFDRREKKVYLFYIEVHKPQFVIFSPEEISVLRQKLPQELKKQIKSDVHPIFLPRNEEEIARNLIVLSQQLKYLRDLPQVIIQYDKQSESELFFSIMIARLLLPRSKGLREQLLDEQSSMKFSIDELREVGKLRRKTPKEAAVLRVSLDKTPFFRADYSVDLLRARQMVAYDLQRVIGEYRDFNGGMILKQEEALLSLRKQIEPMTQETEFLLEEYFYSLRPGVMQTVVSPDILKIHFNLFERCKRSSELLIMSETEKFCLIFGKSKNTEIKIHVEIALEKLKIPSYELTSCFLQFSPFNFVGYILRSDNLQGVELFKKTIEKAMRSVNSSADLF